MVGLLSLSGCQLLSPSGDAVATNAPAAIEFKGIDGQVSAARSRGIVGRLDDQTAGSDLLVHHLALEQAMNSTSPLVLGNRLTLLENGPDTYAAMFAAIRAATDHINLETYIFDDDEIGRQFADLLIERQSAGVQVNIIYDSIGGLATPPAFYERMRESGIRLLEFNPIDPRDVKTGEWLLNNRDHRRQLVIDGRTAFTGGVNISATYASAPFGKQRGPASQPPREPVAGWRDTHLKIEGPVVAEFQWLFLDTWARQAGEPLPQRRYFPAPEVRGDEIVRVIGSTAADPESLIYLTLVSAINHASQHVHLTIAYFAPEPRLLEALKAAAGRGVEVQLVLPSYSDSWPVFHVGRSHYAELLRAGVRIHERQGAVMHAKTATIDGVWSTIGSTNLDWRSFLHNDELNAVVLGRDFAAQMDAMFAEDLAQSKEISLEAWSDRSLLLRLKERIARLGAYWL
jgi:cardiolipin synthase A/B